MRWIIALLGVLAVPLGGLWLSQGLGIVRLEPILCFGECAPLQGPSLAWPIAGAAMLAGGILASAIAQWSRRERKR